MIAITRNFSRRNDRRVLVETIHGFNVCLHTVTLKSINRFTSARRVEIRFHRNDFCFQSNTSPNQVVRILYLQTDVVCREKMFIQIQTVLRGCLFFFEDEDLRVDLVTWYICCTPKKTL